jgi:hypothetical protein
LSCLAVSFTGMLAFISCFFHGSLVGFVAARNWSSRLRSATSWQSCIASVLVAPSSSRSIAYLERLFCMWLYRVWSRCLNIMVGEAGHRDLVWHCQGFRLYWRWRSRSGRPSVDREVRDLIQQVNSANPLWGAPGVSTASS